MNPMETLEEVVNKATDKMLIGPDWTFNLRIIDTLNNKPELANQIGQLIRKRLKNRSGKVVSLAIDLLDALLKNCSCMHSVGGSSEMMNDLVSVVTTTSTKKSYRVAKEKALDFIQFWGEVFKESQEYHFYDAYVALLRQGISFPPKRQEKYTPPPQRKPSSTTSVQTAHGNISSTSKIPAQSSQTENVSLSIQQLIDTSKTNSELLRQLLLNIPITSQSSEIQKYVAGDDLLQEVVNVCRQLHTRLVNVVSEGQELDERQTATLLDLTTTMMESLTLYDQARQQGIHPTQNPLLKKSPQMTTDTSTITTSVPSTISTQTRKQNKTTQQHTHHSTDKHEETLRKNDNSETISIVLPSKEKSKSKNHKKHNEKKSPHKKMSGEGGGRGGESSTKSTTVFNQEAPPVSISTPPSTSNFNAFESKKDSNETIDDEFAMLARRERPSNIIDNNVKSTVTPTTNNPFASLLFTSPSSTLQSTSPSPFISQTTLPLSSTTTTTTLPSTVSSPVLTSGTFISSSTSTTSPLVSSFFPSPQSQSILTPSIPISNPSANNASTLPSNNPFLTVASMNTATSTSNTSHSLPTKPTTTTSAVSVDDVFKDL